ncbi:UNVERIFIED_CONTAM: hypothetical protein FKN15_041817 [Acipenser sinensis]
MAATEHLRCKSPQDLAQPLGGPNSGEEDGPGERGLLHTWKGYSCSVTPQRVLWLGSKTVLQAALGTRHGVLLTEGGEVYSFGELPWRQGSANPAPVPILEQALIGQQVVAVAAGSFHSGAISEDGTAYMWGENSSGQCGVASKNVVPDPMAISIADPETSPPQQIRIKQLACGEQHTIALSVHSEVWAWGSGCQLGLVTSVFPVSKPQKVEHLAGRRVLQIACGAFHSLALVQRLPPQEAKLIPDKCNHCNQLLITMTDKEDHVIISDSHYCPLGVELADSEQRQRSPLQKLRRSPSEPSLGSTVTEPSGKDSPTMVHRDEKDPGPTKLAPEEMSEHSDRGDLKESDPEANGAGANQRVKNSPYPDKQVVKEYLKRLSDHSLVEQTAKNAQGPQVRGFHSHRPREGSRKYPVFKA